MKILLLAPLLQNALFENDILAKWPPLGLLYLASVLDRQGHQSALYERRLFDLRRRRDEAYFASADADLLVTIEKFSPDWVGITMTTPQVSDAYHCARLIKQRYPQVKIVVGGVHASVQPLTTLAECPEIDYLCEGEGEGVISELVAGGEVKKISGLYYRDGSVQYTGPRKPFLNIDEIPYPKRELLNQEYYFSPSSMHIRGMQLRATSIFSSRGCPYQCHFCASPHLLKLGGKVRFHSPEYVIGEIRELVSRYQLNGILFAEDMFSLKVDRVQEICRLMVAENLHKHIVWAANMRVDSISNGLLQDMKRAGCVRIVYGCESGSDHVLRLMHKSTSVAQNRAAIEATKRAGITCEANMIVGVPGERQIDLEETIRFLKQSRPDRINKSKLYPIPGSRYYAAIPSVPSNWNSLWNDYVATSATLADMEDVVFEKMVRRLEREVILPTNYLFAFKTNLRRHPWVAIQQILLMIVHVSILYFPRHVGIKLRQVADRLQIKSRVVFK